MRTSSFREQTCPACGHHVAVPFFNGGRQPLATLGWPRTAGEAAAMTRLPLDFVRCVSCSHVFNASFDYENVPYSAKPNLMFNRPANWSRFMEAAERRILDRLDDQTRVIEIGHGDGSFLEALAKRRPGGRFIGFDPHGAEKSSGNVQFRRELFLPPRHLAELQPDLLISRHVLEHLANPLGFLQGISFAADELGLAPLAYLEVPCIDATIRDRRTVDFYYEHSSQFTTNSFSRMLFRAAAEILDFGHGYGREVVFGLVRLGQAGTVRHFVEEARAFRADAESGASHIAQQLAELYASGRRVAIWGGTGKSAAFMCRHGVDAGRFPIVIDSDEAKVGTFVPGTGQEIRSREWLRAHPVDVVIIPPYWRALDIVAEISKANIAVSIVLVERQGQLMAFPPPEVS